MAYEIIPEQINWDNYRGFEVLTADRAIVGTVEAVDQDPDSNEVYFSIDGSTGFEDVIRISVEAIGVVGKSFLMLDIVADNFDTLGAGKITSTSPTTRNRRRWRAPREAHFSPVRTNNRRASAGEDGLTTSHFKIVPEVEYRRDQTIRADHPEIAVTRILDNEVPTHLHTLERRTEVLEQLLLDFFIRQRIDPERAHAAADASTLAANMISAVYGHPDDDSFTAEWKQFSERSLAETDIIYLFANTVYSSLRQETGISQDFLATWGIRSNGDNVLIHLSLGRGGSPVSWMKHFASLQERGFRDPITVTTVNNPGLIEAVETTWPNAIRIRCWAEKMSSLLDETPASFRPLVKLWMHAIRDAPDRTQGEILAGRVAVKFRDDCPHTIVGLEHDLSASLAHLDLPVSHRPFVRNTTLPDRTFLDGPLRALALPRMSSDDDALKIVFGMLMRASQKWRSIKSGILDREQIETYINANLSRRG